MCVRIGVNRKTKNSCKPKTLKGPTQEILVSHPLAAVSLNNRLYIQLRSEIQPFEIWKHLKSGLFGGRNSNGPVFKWSGFSYGF